MEGRNVQLELRGIVRSTPALTSPDGELEDCVNIRHKDGAARPILAAKVIKANLQYSDIYIHRNTGYGHYIGLNAGKLYHFANDVDGVFTAITPVQICTVNGFPTYTQTGNVVNILDLDGLQYAIWYDSAYVLISTNFDGEQTDTSIGPVGRVDLKVDGETSNNIRVIRAYVGDHTGGNTPSDDLYKSTYEGLVAKAFSKEQEAGRLVNFHLACTAYQLYDGSYILHSQPVLLGQAWDLGSRYNVDGLNYITNKASVWAMWNGNPDPTSEGYIAIPSVLSYAEFNGVPEQRNYIPNFAGLYTGYRVSCLASGNLLKYKIEKSIPSNLKPLIKSLSIFISMGVSMYDLSKDATLYTAGVHKNLVPTIKTDADILKELKDLQVFYKVKDVYFDDMTSGNWVTIDLKGKLGDLLLTQEALPVDPFSHHKTTPVMQFTYNSKLHIANYSTQLSRGWPAEYFFYQPGIGQFGEFYEASVDASTGFYWEISTDIQTQQGVATVVRHKQYLAGTSPTTFSGSINPLLSYPDNRAVKMKIRLMWKDTMLSPSNGKPIGYAQTFALTPHATHNYAYYLNPTIKHISAVGASFVWDFDPPVPPLEIANISQSVNVLKVSEINNPFTFPAATTYQVGNGEIRAMASNSIALSTGQFGEFPLYVFCSDGVYALYVGGGAVTYSASKPVARDVVNNPKSVRSVDGGVVFTTDRGAMLIAGAQVTDLSKLARGDVQDYSNEDSPNYLAIVDQATRNDLLVRLGGAIDTDDLLTYLEGAQVGYNHKEREIWFTNPAKTYSYIFTNGVWSKATISGEQFVHDYPKDLLLDSSGNLKDISEAEGSSAQCMFLTRPIKMGTQGFKSIMRAVIRGLLKTGSRETGKLIPVYKKVPVYKKETITRPVILEYLQDFQGGKIIKITQPGESGYDATRLKGVVVSQTEQYGKWRAAMDGTPQGWRLPLRSDIGQGWQVGVEGSFRQNGQGAIDPFYWTSEIEAQYGQRIYVYPVNFSPGQTNTISFPAEGTTSDYNAFVRYVKEFDVAAYETIEITTDEIDYYDEVLDYYEKELEWKYAGFYIFGSVNGLSWEFLGGSEKKGEFADIGTLTERVDAKYIRLAFVGDLDASSSISSIELDAKPRQTNKLR